MTNYDIYLRGFVGGYDFDARYVEYVLTHKSQEQVNVLISSTGGNLDTALQISNAFQRHGNVNVHFVGFNASAATIASLGAKNITIEKSAFYLVHQCSQEFFLWNDMNKDDLEQLKQHVEQAIIDLEKFDSTIAELYANKCNGKTKDELTDLMKKGGWLTAKEAKDWGFVDEISETEQQRSNELAQLEVAAMVKAGIPMPPVGNNDKPGWVKSLINDIKAIIKPNNSTNMKLKNLQDLLNVDDFTANDGKISLTVEQMQTINAALEKDEDNDTTVEETTDEEPANNEEQIQDKEQTDETTTTEATEEAEADNKEIKVINNGTSKSSNINDFAKHYNNAKEMFNLLK